MVLQATLGIVAGAMFWTMVQLATPGIGHWLVNALALAPLLAGAAAGVIYVSARRFVAFGWSFFVGAVVYGYLFSFVVLVHI